MAYPPEKINARPVHITILIPANKGFHIKIKENSKPKTP